MNRSQPSRRKFLGNAMALSSLATVPFRHTFGQAATDTLARSRVAVGQHGVVATVHPLASEAAIAAFDRGGNAIDAAIAASLMLGVVDGQNSGIGGGCLALVHKPNGKTIAIDGRETAPGLASPKMFFRAGRPDPRLSRIGPLAAGVPGQLAALDRLCTEHGKLDWQAALLGAADIAENGFVVTQDYETRLRSAAADIARYPTTAAILLNNIRHWKTGETLRQSDLATTLRSIAQQGTGWFYEGEFAAQVDKFMRSSGGLLRQSDFAKYKTVSRPPIRTPYRKNSVIGFPPPSSGGIHIGQMLGMLSGFDVKGIFKQDPTQGLHLLIEVMKRAMADRAHWLGDADFTDVPRSLLDAEYLKQRASTIDLSKTNEVKSHGLPPRADIDLFGQKKHTTHLTTADSDGNVVAITQTVNTTFGCKMIVPGTGVVLNNEMDDFSIAPGVRNAFGLVGSEANLIAPGKRPLSSMSPTIVLGENNTPVLSCGAAGGPKIITAVLQVLVRVLDLGQSIEDALAAPRVHHQWSPDNTIIENSHYDKVNDSLQAMGHITMRIQSSAVSQGLSISGDELTAASDPRVSGSAMST